MIDPTHLCQIEIHVTDMELSRRFYEEVMGWKVSPAEIHMLTVLEVPEHCHFGISLVSDLNPSQSNSNHTILYFRHKDPKAVAERAASFNGAKVSAPMKLPSYGKAIFISDPDGQKFGIMELG